MRYLGQFPSEAQVRDAILPEVYTATYRSKKMNLLNQSSIPSLNPTCLEVIYLTFSAQRAGVRT